MVLKGVSAESDLQLMLDMRAPHNATSRTEEIRMKEGIDSSHLSSGLPLESLLEVSDNGTSGYLEIIRTLSHTYPVPFCIEYLGGRDFRSKLKIEAGESLQDVLEGLEEVSGHAFGWEVWEHCIVLRFDATRRYPDALSRAVGEAIEAATLWEALEGLEQACSRQHVDMPIRFETGCADGKLEVKLAQGVKISREMSLREAIRVVLAACEAPMTFAAMHGGDPDMRWARIVIKSIPCRDDFETEQEFVAFQKRRESDKERLDRYFTLQRERVREGAEIEESAP